MYNMNKKGKRHYYYAPINAPINIQSPINVMPGGGMQGMGWGFDCLCWPEARGRAFD